MLFIGIISNEKEENYIDREIEKELGLKENSVLFIKEKSIENIKNIKFETIIINRKFKNTKILKEMIKNAKYLIINSDIEENLKLLENIKATVITYGFNSKATITASSVGEDEIIICVQRTIKNKSGNNIELQEIKYPIYNNPNNTMAIAGLLLLYKNNFK